MTTGTIAVIVAYVGPGAGLGLIGALVGLLLAVLGALACLLAWPLRALLRKMRSDRPAPADAGGSDAAGSGREQPAVGATSQ